MGTSIKLLMGIFFGLLLISSVNAAFYCRQEYSNVSTPCGGKSTGTYSFSVFDGSTNAAHVLFYINYTVPDNVNNVTNTSLWDVKYGSLNVGTQRRNVSIDLKCFNNSFSDKLTLRVNASSIRGDIRFNCYTGTTWLELYYATSSGAGIGGGTTGYDMWWLDGYWNIGNYYTGGDWSGRYK